MFQPELLECDKRVVLEVGCGVGWHPIQLAEQLGSSALVIAIERTANKFNSFRNRLNHHPEFQSSICAVHGDAYHFVDRHFPIARIDDVWMLYPNPEIKRTSLRWYNAPSFQRIVDAMKPGGHFHFATNLEDFANEGAAVADRFNMELISRIATDRTSNPQFRPRSHFEKKYFERKETLHSLEFRKKTSP
jgi:tRNA G46 methylase TrmB